MIKSKLILIALCFCAFSYAQDDSLTVADEAKLENALSMMYKSNIEMDIDKEVYVESQGNSHFTADQKSAIIGMVVPSSYQKMKKDMDRQETKEGLTFLDKGELVNADGKKILFMKSSLERDGEVYIMLIYCKENTEESSIMITSYFEEDKEEAYSDLIKKAAFSAILN